MRRFFDELTELKIQQGELPEPRAKKVKQTPLDLAIQEAGGPLLDALPPAGLETSITQPGQSDLLPIPQSMLQPTPYEAETVTHKKGGRPKLPLFSVRPCRQKTRTQKIMEFIRDFALKNGENVDDILWTLLTLRVKGSGNLELSNDLEKLYKHWSMYVSNNGYEVNPPAQYGNVMTLLNPMQQNLQVGAGQGMEVDMNPSDPMYQMRLNMDNPMMVPTDQNEITSV